MKSKTHFIALSISIFLWASSFPGIKAGLQSYSPFEVASIRFMVASIILLIAAPFMKVRVPSLVHLRLILPLGLIGVTSYHLLVNYGETQVSAGATSFIANLAPIFTIFIAGLFLREKIGLIGWVGVVISCLGTFCISLSESNQWEMNPGVLILLLAALCWSLFFILQKPLLKNYDPFEITCYSVWVGSLALLFFLPYSLEAIKQADIEATISVMYLGIFPTAVAYLSWAYVLSRITVSKASIFTYLVPVVSVFISVSWLDEQLSFLLVLGGILTIAGIVLANQRKLKVAFIK